MYISHLGFWFILVGWYVNFTCQFFTIIMSLNCTISEYLSSKEKLKDRIAAIDVLIDKAILSLAETLDGVGANISTYELDDGQVKIKTGYRSIDEVEAGIKSLERMKNLYINKLYGRSVQLRDNNTFCR